MRISLVLTLFRHSITLLMYVFWHSYGGNGKLTRTPLRVSCGILLPLRFQPNPLFPANESQLCVWQRCEMLICLYPVQLGTSASRRLPKHTPRLVANPAYFLVTSLVQSTESEFGQVTVRLTHKLCLEWYWKNRNLYIYIYNFLFLFLFSFQIPVPIIWFLLRSIIMLDLHLYFTWIDHKKKVYMTLRYVWRKTHQATCKTFFLQYL